MPPNAAETASHALHHVGSPMAVSAVDVLGAAVRVTADTTKVERQIVTASAAVGATPASPAAVQVAAAASSK